MAVKIDRRGRAAYGRAAMRKFVWVAGLLLLIVIALFVAAALSLNRIIGHNRGRILDQATVALGREVAADQMTISLWGGLGIRVDNLRIADNPQFATADFLRAGTVIARAKLWPLLQGRLEIGRIDLRQPEIHLVRDSSGQWNYASIARPASTPDAAPPSGPPVAGVPPEQIPFVVGRANIEAGTIKVTDQSQHPEQAIAITQLDLAVGDLSETTPIRFTLDAAVLADTHNVHVRGTAGPWTQPSSIPLRLDGKFGPLGPQHLRVDDLHLQAALTPTSMQISQLSGRAFDGSFRFAGQYPFGHDGEATLQGELTRIALPQVLRLTMRDAPQRFAGTGRLTLNLRATGASPDAWCSTLSGQISADVQDAVLKDFNLVNEVLGRVTDVPKVGALISRNVKPKYARLFSEPDTRVQTLQATFHLADQRMRTDDLTIVATDYDVLATGWIGFNRDMDLAGTLAMSKAFSRDVVADVKEAKYLLDARAQLAVPFRLRGRIGEARPRPDTGYVLERLAQGIAPGAVKDLLEKLLGSNPHQPATPKPGGQPSGAIEQRLRDLLGR